MCVSGLYAVEGDMLKELMADTARVFSVEEGIIAINVTGEKLELNNYRIVDVDAIAHRIIVGRVK